VEVAVEAEELAQVVEDQEAEAEKVAAAKALAMGVPAEARVEAVGERASAALAADLVVVELADRAALEGFPAAVGEVAEGLVVDLEAGAPDQVGAQADQVGAQADQVGAQADQAGAQADQVEAQVDQAGAQAAEVQVVEEVRLAVEAQEPSLVNG
jgi:RND superfamily putative drug exporter